MKTTQLYWNKLVQNGMETGRTSNIKYQTIVYFKGRLTHTFFVEIFESVFFPHFSQVAL